VKQKKLIGRTDKVDFPEFGLFNIRAKIDTGAYTSSINSKEIKVSGKIKKKLSFKISDPFTELQSKVYSTYDFVEKEIKNSFGQSERRFVIKTSIILFGKEYETEFSLSDRSGMKYPVLLGRKFLKEGFLVDISVFNLSYKEKIKKKREENK
jgi:hypothetical protein